MTLYVCRHGRTEANASGLLLGRADPELDATGQSQATAMAAALPTPDLVVSSPLARCRQTAAAFAARSEVDVGIEIDERLIELDYGDFDLKPLRDIPAEVWRQWREDPDFRPPGGETLQELSTRVSGALDAVADRAAEADVVIVSHVSPIKAALAWALGVGIGVSWRSFVAQASVTEIGVGPNGPSLRMFNGVAHLDGLDEAVKRS
ncbi:MAG: histidine phosphatase family protein [Actinomycetota bacterium]